tara:strand:- start:7412 stop:7579 length:168 start_codon:yes stop_codon:yes gene_type:complete
MIPQMMAAAMCVFMPSVILHRGRFVKTCFRAAGGKRRLVAPPGAAAIQILLTFGG